MYELLFNYFEMLYLFVNSFIQHLCNKKILAEKKIQKFKFALKF